MMTNTTTTAGGTARNWGRGVAAVMVLMVVALVSACFPGSTSDDREMLEADGNQFRALPAWVVDTPSLPGEALFTVGVAAFDEPELPVFVRQAAEADAREAMNRLAERWNAAVTASGAAKIDDETLSDDATNGLATATAEAFRECAVVVRRYVTPNPDAVGLRYVYVLLRLPMAVVRERWKHTLDDVLSAPVSPPDDPAETWTAVLSERFLEWHTTHFPPRDLPAALADESAFRGGD